MTVTSAALDAGRRVRYVLRATPEDRVPRRPTGTTAFARRLDAAGIGNAEVRALCGVGKWQVNRWRNGRAPLPMCHAETLARRLGTDAGTLCGEVGCFPSACSPSATPGEKP